MKAKELMQLINAGKQPLVLDVRTHFEFRSNHIPGATNTSTWRILFGLAALPKDKGTSIVVTCEHGPRAGMAAAALRWRGFRNVSLLEGHMSEWRGEGYPDEKGNV
jgi:rhodanese-related sulfurtransferase